MTPPSQSRRLLIGLLIVAWGVLDVVLTIALRWFSESHATGETLVLVIVLGCYFSQFATLAGWLPLGDGRLVVRLTFCVLTFFVLHGLFWFLGSRVMNAEGYVFMWASVYAALVVLVIGVLRLFGYRCTTTDQPEGAAGPLQFSIRQIFWLTTGAAVVLAIVKHMPWNMPGSDLREFILITLILTDSALITWLSVFRLPVIIGTITPLVAALVHGLIAGGIEGHDYWPWIGFTLITALGLIINLQVLRVAGYSLTRCREKATFLPDP